MSCNKCGKCCKSTGQEKRIVIIYPSDLLQISEKFHITQKEFVHRYCEEDYVQCDHDIIKMYILKNVEDKCIFLSENNLCKIFNERPVQCKEAPYNYFSFEEIWGHMPCFDLEEMLNSNSTENDEKLVQELISGYHL